MPEAHGPSALARAVARLRVGIGSLWLKAFIRRNRDREPAALLDLTWTAARRYGRFFAGAELYRNGQAYGWQSMLLRRVLVSLDRAGVRCIPNVTVHGMDILRTAAAETKQPIVVMVHSPVDTILNRVFREAGISWTLLATRADRVLRRARLLGLSGELDTVARTNDSLLVLRRKLTEGQLVCGCVDFVQAPNRSARGHVFVSPALFELAKWTGSPIVYADTAVLEDGTIEATFALPRLDAAEATALAAAEDFIAWLKTDRGDRRDWAVRKWVPRLRRRSAFFRLVRRKKIADGGAA
jgi:hypothetical protein